MTLLHCSAYVGEVTLRGKPVPCDPKGAARLQAELAGHDCPAGVLAAKSVAYGDAFCVACVDVKSLDNALRMIEALGHNN